MSEVISIHAGQAESSTASEKSSEVHVRNETFVDHEPKMNGKLWHLFAFVNEFRKYVT